MLDGSRALVTGAASGIGGAAEVPRRPLPFALSPRDGAYPEDRVRRALPGAGAVAVWSRR